MRLADVEGEAACKDKLHIVDAAFARPGGPAAHRMEKEICPSCPIWTECLVFAMDHGERGTWGGTTERARRKVHHLPFTANTGTRNLGIPVTRRMKKRVPAQ